MKVAVIGACGWAGQRHLRAFVGAGATVTHVVDQHPSCADLAKQHNASAVADYRALLDADVDAVSIALPPSEQPDICKALLSQGISVLCEKPVAMNVEQARDIRDFVSRTSGAVFMPAFLLRFHPAFLRLRDLIASASLGRIHALAIDTHVRKESVDGWRLDPRMGGVTLVHAIHAFDLARWLVGEIGAPDFAAVGNRRFEIPTEDWMESMLSGHNGVRVHIRAAWWPFRESDDFTLDMEGWVLRLRLEAEQGIAVLRRDGLSVLRGGTSEFIPMTMDDDLFGKEVAHFMQCVADGTTPCVDANDNLAAQRLVAQTVERGRAA